MNIYETLLRGHDWLCNPPISHPPTEIRLRTLWDLGSDSLTAIALNRAEDTMFVQGRSDTDNTDEWDDDILLHEYGHFALDVIYKDSIPGGTVHWTDSVTSYPKVVWSESWADFFSGQVRAGTGTDSLMINTQGGIGLGGQWETWWNLEEPWAFEFNYPDTMEGGPWCKGTVTGSLCDIDDSVDENTYPVHTAPGWPDTNLANTLSLGIEKIWSIFETDSPPGPDTNCWSIYRFISAWRSPERDYGHETERKGVRLRNKRYTARALGRSLRFHSSAGLARS